MDCKLTPLLRYSSLAVLLLFVVATHAEELVPKYDDITSQRKYFDIKKILHLSCNITSGSGEIEWRKNDIDITQIESLQDRINIIPAEHTLQISKAEESDAGNYSCRIKGKDYISPRYIDAYATVAVKLPENSAVVEGEKLILTCTGVGSDVKFNWTIGNNTMSQSTDRIELKSELSDEKKLHIATLVLNDTKIEDRGDVTCIGYNDISVSKSTTLVRVKGKYAALWPFLGICAEVFVLCAIILIYEKRRNKTDLDESDTDQSPDQKNDHHHGKDSDVRHRK